MHRGRSECVLGKTRMFRGTRTREGSPFQDPGTPRVLRERCLLSPSLFTSPRRCRDGTVGWGGMGSALGADGPDSGPGRRPLGGRGLSACECPTTRPGKGTPTEPIPDPTTGGAVPGRPSPEVDLHVLRIPPGSTFPLEVSGEESGVEWTTTLPKPSAHPRPVPLRQEETRVGYRADRGTVDGV